MKLEPFTVIGIYEGEPVHAWVLGNPDDPDALWSRAVRQATRSPDLRGDCGPSHPDSFTGICIANVPGWHRPRFPAGLAVVPTEIRWLTNSSGEPVEAGAEYDTPIPYDYTPGHELDDLLGRSVALIGAYLVEVDGTRRAAFTLECMYSNGEPACPWHDGEPACPWPDEDSVTLWLDMVTEEILTRLPPGWAILPRHADMPERWTLTILARLSSALTCEGARDSLEFGATALLIEAVQAVRTRIALGGSHEQ